MAYAGAPAIAGWFAMNAFLSSTNAWVLLAAAGVLEIVWSVSMKASAGFTKVPFAVLTFVAAWISFWLLGLAMRTLPVGTAYAVWTGIGAVGAALLGIVIFHEPATLARMGCIALIVAGILGLKFLSPGSAA
jgi:quaternary ammonium compound-resistance protein SugE